MFCVEIIPGTALLFNSICHFTNITNHQHRRMTQSDSVHCKLKGNYCLNDVRHRPSELRLCRYNNALAVPYPGYVSAAAEALQR